MKESIKEQINKQEGIYLQINEQTRITESMNT